MHFNIEISKIYALSLFTILSNVTCALKQNSHLHHKGHLKPFGSSGPYLNITEFNINILSTKSFFNNYVKYKVPLLFKFEAKQFDAFNLWTDEYLLEKSIENKDFKILIETEKKESRQQDINLIEFNEFLSNYKSNDAYMVNQVPFFLKKDIQLPTVLQCEQATFTLDDSIMWFSSGGTKSVTHTDDYENILCLLDGSKKLILVDSKKYEHLVPNIIDITDGSYSSMDVESVDYEKYIGIENLEYYKVNLEAGDCVYIPFRWVHQVESFDRNIGVNFWFNYEKIFNNSEFSDECSANKFDNSKTLDKYNYKRQNDNFDVLRSFILRNINNEKRSFDDWINVISKELRIDESFLIDIPELNKVAHEIFNNLDYDGNGEVSNEEVVDIDEKQLEQIEGLFYLVYLKLKNEDPNEQEKSPNTHDQTEL